MSSIPATTGTPVSQDRIDYNPAGYAGVGKDPPGNGKTIAIAILIVIGVVFFAIYFTFKCTNWRPWSKSTKGSGAGVQAARPAPAAAPANKSDLPGSSNVWHNQVREPDLEMGGIPPAKTHNRYGGSTTSDNTTPVSYGNFPEPGSYGHVLGPKDHTSTRDDVNPYSPYPSADDETSPYVPSSSTDHTSNPYYQSPYPRASSNQTTPSSNIFARKDGRRPSAEYVERNKALFQQRLRSSGVPQLDTSVAGKGLDKPLPVVPGVNRAVSPVSDMGTPGNVRSVSPVGDGFEEISLEDGVASPGTKKARGYWK
jgi:hypothetical protein